MQSPRNLAIVNGSQKPQLTDSTLGKLTDRLASEFGSKSALIVSWTQARLSFRDLRERSRAIAKGLLERGVGKGDRVAIFSGDDERYVELFLAAGRLGAVFVTLNKSYTWQECEAAIRASETNILFLSDTVYHRSTDSLVDHLKRCSPPSLKGIVFIRLGALPSLPEHTGCWDDLLVAGHVLDDSKLAEAESKVHCHDTVNFQFTSGTTGQPKAVMLSHFNIINNALLTGDLLRMTEDDIVCCAPPLFHCFGLVIGFMAAFTHGVPTIFGKQDFDAASIVDIVIKERCTVMHAVPTMLSVILEHLRQTGRKITTVKTGIVGGTRVSPALVEEVKKSLGYRDITIAYGMTETSPVSFMTQSSDTIEQKLNTVGRIIPHASAKVVDRQNRIVRRGERGELCISGFLLHQGYYNNHTKTAEVMIRDEKGKMWMHTGDEAFIDQDGYCTITGRMKDLIIRGGENIHPLEIEERLIMHSTIHQASVVGLKDEKYGEQVAAFVQQRPGYDKISLADLRAWVREALGRHKEPRLLFWVGNGDFLDEFPYTASGKIRKDILRQVGNDFLKESQPERPNKL